VCVRVQTGRLDSSPTAGIVATKAHVFPKSCFYMLGNMALFFPAVCSRKEFKELYVHAI